MLFDSRADAAAATIPTGEDAVLTLGYAAPGDLGGATYKRVVASTRPGSFTSNGGTVVWDLAEAVVTPQMFGAKGDKSVFDTQAIQDAVDYAQGSKVFFPEGQYAINDTIVNATTAGGAALPMHISGVGTGSGVGAAEQLNEAASVIEAYFGNKDVFHVVCHQPSIFENIRIQTEPNNRPATAGAGIRLEPKDDLVHVPPIYKTTANSIIRNVGFSQLYRGIHLIRPFVIHIHDVYCDSWVDAAIHSEADRNDVESGGGFWSNLHFFGSSSLDSTSGPCIRLNHGYTTIRDALLQGGSYAVDASISKYPAGSLRIVGGYYEDQRLGGVRLQSVDGNTLAMVLIDGVEFSKLQNSDNYLSHIVIQEYVPEPGSPVVDWISLVNITNIVCQSNLKSTAKYVWAQTGTNVTISNCQFADLGSNAPNGIQVTGNTSSASIKAPYAIESCLFTGTFNKVINAVAATQVHHDQGITFAKLEPWANGSTVYVTDGTNGSNPLTSGGTGAIAKRLNGAWIG